MKITDDMLYQHAEEARDIWLRSLPDDSELQPHTYSAELLSRLENIEAQTKQSAKPRRSFTKVAAVFLVLLLGVGTWIGTDMEVQAAVANWVRTVFGNQVIYRYMGEAPEDAIPDYQCTWLPEGFVAVEASSSADSGDVVYFCGDEKFAVFSYYYMREGAALALEGSTEDGVTHTTLEIHGMHADFYEEGEDYASSLVWMDDEKKIAYDIHGNLTQAEATRMAESVIEGQALLWMPRYVFTWLPKDFVAEAQSWGSHDRYEVASKEEGGFLTLEYGFDDGYPLTEQFGIWEYTRAKKVMVQEQEATLYFNTHKEEHSLIWLDEQSDIAFCLASKEDEETMLRIAEAVKPE